MVIQASMNVLESSRPCTGDIDMFEYWASQKCFYPVSGTKHSSCSCVFQCRVPEVGMLSSTSKTIMRSLLALRGFFETNALR